MNENQWRKKEIMSYVMWVSKVPSSWQRLFWAGYTRDRNVWGG